MSLRPFLLMVGRVVVVALGACTLNTAGVASSMSSGAATGAGGAPAFGAAGGGQAGETSATAQSGASVGAGGTNGAGTSNAASSTANSSVSSAVSSVTASASSSASSSSSSGGGVTCDAQFNGAAGYQLCKDNGPTSCEFRAIVKKSNCDDVCANLGGECTATFDNVVDCTYESGPLGCDAKYNDAICRCSLKCGNSAPCAPNHACNNGNCAP